MPAYAWICQPFACGCWAWQCPVRSVDDRSPATCVRFDERPPPAAACAASGLVLTSTIHRPADDGRVASSFRSCVCAVLRCIACRHWPAAIARRRAVVCGFPRWASAIFQRRSGSWALAHIAHRAFLPLGDRPFSARTSRSPSVSLGTPNARRHSLTVDLPTPHQCITAHADSCFRARARSPQTIIARLRPYLPRGQAMRAAVMPASVVSPRSSQEIVSPRW